MPTTPDEFPDFPIHIVPQDVGKYSVDIRLADGGEFYGTFAANDLLPWTSSGDLEQDGHRLFKTLFPADSKLREAWHTARERSPHRRIRLEIAPDAAELHSLPWELLHDGVQWLTTLDAMPFSRYLPGHQDYRLAFTAYPLRILVAISNPDDLAAEGLIPIDVAHEQALLEEAFAQSIEKGWVELDVLPPPITLANLEAALSTGYQALHLVAHGAVRGKDKAVALYLQGDDGMACTVSAGQLAAIFGQEHVPHLVFLSACHSGALSAGDVLVGFGPALVAAGIPAVVAMQDAVSLPTAQRATVVFYQALMRYGAVDRALNRARRNLLAAGRSDLGAPVLLMHLNDGQIWLEMPPAICVDEGRKTLVSLYQKFGDKWLEWLRGELQLCRDTPTDNENIRQWAGILLDALDDSPTFERLCRDIPWLLLFGTLLVEFAKTTTTEVAVAVITDMLRRPRAERELPTLPQPPAPQQASSPSKPSPGRRIASRGDWEPELVFIPAGNFLMGTTERQAAALRKQFDEPSWYKFEWETPQHTLYLPDYYIGKYPVTNAQYRAFVQATGHRAPGYWDEGQIPRGKEQHPVKWLYWKDAVAYCEWLTEKIQDAGCKIKVWRGGVLVTEVLPRASCIVRLSTEAEWEKAARGPDGRVYPWGDNPPTERLCNFDNKVKDTTPVGVYSQHGGDSPYGCVDMAGNVWEWTSTRWGPKWEEPLFRYPYRADDGREDMRSEDWRVARGGSYWYSQEYVRCAFRLCRRWLILVYDDSGLRVCVAAPFSHPFGL